MIARTDNLINPKQIDFINEWLINGHNATDAYKKAYPKNKTPAFSASRLLSNVKIKAEIDKRTAVLAKKVGRTVESLDDMYQEVYDDARTLKQPAACVSAVTGIARLYGMDKDNNARESTVIVINPPKRVESEVIENEV